jgi:hypothetical protein
MLGAAALGLDMEVSGWPTVAPELSAPQVFRVPRTRRARERR